jgi:hypothetical protein
MVLMFIQTRTITLDGAQNIHRRWMEVEGMYRVLGRGRDFQYTNQSRDKLMSTGSGSAFCPAAQRVDGLQGQGQGWAKQGVSLQAPCVWPINEGGDMPRSGHQLPSHSINFFPLPFGYPFPPIFFAGMGKNGRP